MATLLGPDGQPIERKTLTAEVATPTIGGVRSLWADHPAAGLTPARLGSILRQAIEGDPEAYLALAEDMEERDLHYLAVLSTRRRQVAQLEITVDPAGEDAASAEHADLVRRWIDRESLEDELIALLDAVGKGFSVLEIMWQTSAGQWMPSELVWRDPRWFRFSRDDGRTLLMRTEAAALGDPLPPYKFAIHKHAAKAGLAIRGGLARSAAWCWLFKHADLASWAAFAERFGMPLRVGKYGAGATDADKRVLLRAVSEIARDAAAIIPDSMMIEFIDAKITGSTELFERHCDWLDRQISKAVLGQTTTTDAISGGHAVSQEHDKVREDIERSDARQVAATLNRDIVQPMIALNFGQQKAYPRIRIGRPEEIDAATVVKAVSMLVPLGLRVGQARLRELLSLPEPGDGEELLAPARGSAMPGATTPENPADPSTETMPPETAAARVQTDSPDPIEQLLTALAADGTLGRAMQPLTGPLASIAAAAGDFETFKARLAEHLTTADVADMADLLAKAMFFGDVAGRGGAKIEG